MRSALLASLLLCARADAPPRVVILALGDDYGFNNVGFPHGPLNAGNPEMRTPHLDALAMAGLRLERHYVYKYCSPTRSALLSGRLPVHVNQNNANNDARAASGIDLRMATLPQKLKQLKQRGGGAASGASAWRTAMVGKWHCGARSPANLPVNRGFDYHLGFLKGGEDHFTQAHCAGGPDASTVDLWEQGAPARGKNGTYSAFLYADAALSVIRNFTRDAAAAPDTDLRLFLYLPWHNTHTPLEAPERFDYPAYPAYNNSFAPRMAYNAMARALDEGMGNVTAALKAAGLWEDTLLLFSADNGGWLLPEGRAGASNYPLRGGKVTDFEGGVRSLAFLAGGYVPAAVRGTRHFGFVSVADWYASVLALAGADTSDDAPGVPPTDSLDVLPSLLSGASTNSTPRTRLPLSWNNNLTAAGAGGAAALGSFDAAIIVDGFKIVCGPQAGEGYWQGPVFPNSTDTGSNPGCVADCCLFDIIHDELETRDLRLEQPARFAQMQAELAAMGAGVYQTNYPEPNTTACLTDRAAKEFYGGFIGPVCFHTSPVPPPPPLTPFALTRASGAQHACLRPGPGADLVAAACSGAGGAAGQADARWVQDVNAEDGWLAWSTAGNASELRYVKVDEHAAPNVTTRADFCVRGRVYLNPDPGASGDTHQGFLLESVLGSLGSTLCSSPAHHCLVVPPNGSSAAGGPCADAAAAGWQRVSL